MIIINKTIYKRLRNYYFQIAVSLYKCHPGFFQHANILIMLYIVHQYKNKFESTNMDLTCLLFFYFSRLGGQLFNTS